MRRIRSGITCPALVVAISLVFMHSASGAARLGATIDDFQSAWGRPTIDERVDRTARFVWGPYDQKTKLPPGISEAQVQFLDKVACAILLRGRLGVHQKWSWAAEHIRQALLDRPQSLPIPRRNSSGSRELTLKDGTFVAVRQFKDRTIILINGPVLLRNEEVFSRELAKIHRPKAEQ